MDKPIPIPTLHLFPVLDKLLIELLRSLEPADWGRPTVCPLWTVKDIAAHLLDTNMRTISGADNHFGKAPENINSYSALVGYLNELNAVWVKAMDRVSPRQLVAMLEITGPQYCDIMALRKPFEMARYAVSWAGEEQSENWFDIAREYTEKWHHQQQIRDAVGKPGIMHRELFYPCMDTFMRALPHTYRNVNAEEGTLIQISISTNNGGDWYLQKNGTGWVLVGNPPGKKPEAVINLKPDTAWKLFTKGMTAAAAIEKSELRGDDKLTQPLFGMLSVMA